MPEPPVVSYESVPDHLIGPTSDFVLPQEDMSVAALAGFKLVSFPSLTNKETLNDQVRRLVGVNEPNTGLQNKILRSKCVIFRNVLGETLMRLHLFYHNFAFVLN